MNTYPKGLFQYQLFAFFTYFDFYIPFKVVYFYHVTGSYSVAASIIGASWIFQSILELPTGVFSDLIGRKKTIVVGAIFGVLTFLCYAISSHFWILILGAFCEGTQKSLYSGNNNAYLHNLIPQDEKSNSFHHLYSRVNAIQGFSMFIAALCAGAILSWSIDSFMWLNLIPQTLALVSSFFLRSPTVSIPINTNILAHVQSALKEIRSNKNLQNLSMSEMFSGAGVAAYEFQSSIMALVWPPWAVGLARGVQEAGVIPSYMYASRLIRWMGRKKIIYVDMITSTLGNILASITQSVVSPFCIMLSLPLYGASDTANQDILQSEFSEKQRATIASINSLGLSISFSIFLYFCGMIANTYGPFWALFATQLFLLPSFYFKWRYLRRAQS